MSEHNDVYTVAGTDLRQFVADWLTEIENADPEAHPIVTAVDEAEPDDRAFMGAATLMQFIGPRVWGGAGTHEELLLYAALAIYQEEGRDLPWDGYAAYVQRAFQYLHQLGEVEAARRLRAEVVNEATRPRDDTDEWRMKMLTNSMGNDPARMAAHDREMARGQHRTLRAAAALDPAGADDPWEMLTEAPE